MQLVKLNDEGKLVRVKGATRADKLFIETLERSNDPFEISMLKRHLSENTRKGTNPNDLELVPSTVDEFVKCYTDSPHPNYPLVITADISERVQTSDESDIEKEDEFLLFIMDNIGEILESICKTGDQSVFICTTEDSIISISLDVAEGANNE